MLKYLIPVFVIAPMLVWAQDSSVTIAGFFNSIMEFVGLIKKGETPALVLASSVMFLVMQFLKIDLIGNWFDKLSPGLRLFVLAVVGQASSIVVSVSTGQGVFDSIVNGLFIQGGAMYIYQHAKLLPWFAKKQ